MNISTCGGRFKPAGDDETGSALDAAGAMGLADPAAAVVAWMELACCAGSGGTGEAGAHSGLSMPAKEMETAR